jgi:hypothetical protein
MRTQKALLFVLFHCILIKASAQEIIEKNAKFHQISFNLGIKNSLVKDLVFSPNLYSGVGFSGGFEYLNHHPRCQLQTNFDISSQDLTTPFSSKNSTEAGQTILQYQLSVVKNIFQKQNFSVYLGPRIASDLYIRNYRFIREDEISLDGFHTLGVVTNAQKWIGDRWVLRISAIMPVMAYVYGRMNAPLDFPQEVFTQIANQPRQVPFSALHNDGDLLFFGQFQQYNFESRIDYFFTRKIFTGFLYGIAFYRYQKYDWVNQALGNYQFNFGVRL